MMFAQNTLNLLIAVFGESSPAVKDFQGGMRGIPKQDSVEKEWRCPDGHEYRGISPICRCDKLAVPDNTRLILKRQLTVLDAQMWILPTASLDFFNEFDPDIQRVSLQRFQDGHYADAVSAAFKELNKQVKD